MGSRLNKIYGTTLVSNGQFSSSGFDKCGFTLGKTPSGQQYTLMCSTVNMARYVGITRRGPGKLTLCDVVVRPRNKGINICQVSFSKVKCIY